MIQSEPAISRSTISTPKASASDVVGVVGPRGDVQEEDEVDAHLRDREDGERDGRCSAPRRAGAAREERRDREQRREREPDEVAAHAGRDVVLGAPFVARGDVAGVGVRGNPAVTHSPAPSVRVILGLPSDRPR